VSYRVRVLEQRSQALAGVGDCRYESPLHEPEQALELLRVLLGREPENERTRWSVPLAGGVRCVELLPELSAVRRDEPLERYLQLLAGSDPGERLLEIRYRRPVGMGQRFIPARHLEHAAGLVRRLGSWTDTYVGVLLRDRRAGGRDAVSHSHLVFVELDAAASEQLLDRSPAPPSMLVASGTRGHVHAYWLLREPVSAQAAQEANRMLALRVGGDLASVDAARILRPPQTFNHKHSPPIEVRLQLLDPQRAYLLEELTASLEDQAAKRGGDKMRPVQAPERPGRGRRTGVADVVHEQLREIPTSEYVTRLTGLTPNREGKISCPFHDDRAPSLQCYGDGTWCCFGCRRGGTVFDFAAALWGLQTKGREFLLLRERLAQQFELHQPPLRAAHVRARSSAASRAGREVPGR
jgi:RepB DNA-primase from phage plasmid/CHC2 zinc finger